MDARYSFGYHCVRYSFGYHEIIFNLDNNNYLWIFQYSINGYKTRIIDVNKSIMDIQYYVFLICIN